MFYCLTNIVLKDMVIYLIPSVVLLEQFLASGESRKNCGVILAID